MISWDFKKEIILEEDLKKEMNMNKKDYEFWYSAIKLNLVLFGLLIIQGIINTLR